MALPANFKKARDSWYPVVGRAMANASYTRGISVSIGTCVVSEYDLARIGDLVSKRKIGLAFADLGSQEGGRYYGANKHDAWIVFDRATVARFDGKPYQFAGLIIHEAVHVVQDEKRACGTTGMREAAAFVVEAWAMMNRQVAQIGGFSQLAEPVAKQIRATGTHKGKAFDALLAALDQAYGKGHVCGDGIQLASPSKLNQPQY